jgi:hypothetical protein
MIKNIITQGFRDAEPPNVIGIVYFSFVSSFVTAILLSVYTTTSLIASFLIAEISVTRIQ